MIENLKFHDFELILTFLSPVSRSRDPPFTRIHSEKLDQRFRRNSQATRSNVACQRRSAVDRVSMYRLPVLETSLNDACSEPQVEGRWNERRSSVQKTGHSTPVIDFSLVDRRTCLVAILLSGRSIFFLSFFFSLSRDRERSFASCRLRLLCQRELHARLTRHVERLWFERYYCLSLRRRCS